VTQIAFPPEVELGAEYEGKVVNITKFGAFVNILPGRDGLLHISRLDGSKRVERVEDYLTEGDELEVRVREIDRGKVSLELVAPLPGATLPNGDGSGGGGGRDKGKHEDRGGRGDRDRGGQRDRNRGDGRRDGNGGDQKSSGGRRKAAKSFSETFEQMQD
jgi:polyribonucleotide nucleotidyltransferase